MEQALAKDSDGRGISSVPVDCYSCKCLRRTGRRALPVGCIGLARGADRRRVQRPNVLYWRPWIHTRTRQQSPQSMPYARGLCENLQDRQKPAEYNHPVRLFWPKSKPLDHMYVEAADLLRNFPVQATISFYNDSESDTDNEDGSSEEEHDSGFESE